MPRAVCQTCPQGRPGSFPSGCQAYIPALILSQTITTPGRGFDLYPHPPK